MSGLLPRAMALVVLLLGVAMIAIALAGGGGPTARGVFLGVVFAALGGGRLLLERLRVRREAP